MSYEYELKNSKLSAKMTALGAELVSLKDTDGIEYIWNADEKYWKRHTPILFPIVGKILEGKYVTGGEEYLLPAHGFARDLNFLAEKVNEEEMTFTLNSTLGTKAMYPFDFCLKVIYTLKEKSLDITYEVTNKDIHNMFFKIGAHPGFMCPLFKDEVIEDYYLAFEQEELATQIFVTPEVYLSHETNTFEGSQIALSKELFKDGPLIFTNYKSSKMTLASNKHDKKLSVTFKGFPYLGIWSTTDEAPFVCIEPWHGHADFINDSQELENKRDIINLDPQETFKCTHSIEI